MRAPGDWAGSCRLLHPLVRKEVYGGVEGLKMLLYS